MTDSSALYEWFVESVSAMHVTDVDSVGQWLQDLRCMTDTECMCVLQGKSLSQDTNDVVFTTSKTTKDHVDLIKAKAQIISTEFAKLFRKLEKERWKQVKTGSLRITCQIRSLLHECNTALANPNNQFTEISKKIMEECAKLAQHAETELKVNGHKPTKLPVIQLLTSLGKTFSSLIDTTLGLLVRKLVGGIAETESIYSVTGAINNLIALGLDGEHMCYLIAREGGIEELFTVCEENKLEGAHATALRAVATICCVSESIEVLEKISGIGRLTDILNDKSASETVRCEAAGVIAQITSPTLDHCQHLAGFIENMDDLIKALTELCVKSSSHEVFLLGSAALANITFMDSLACDYLSQYNTAALLIEACHLEKASSVFAKDQVVTVLANMAGLESCCGEIIENHGVEVLVRFLYEPKPEFGSEAESAACERLHQKSAIALTRLCRDEDSCQTVLDLQGIPRLIQLCQDPKQRHNSDAVLVACLAALRKISGICTLHEIDQDAAERLITPKLMDSFIACSNVEESIV